MQSIETIKSEMAKLAAWAIIPTEKYDKLFIVPKDPVNQNIHFNNLNDVYTTEFEDLLDTWDSLPEHQWENTRVVGRDLPEWKELILKLKNFRTALMRVRKFPKKLKPVQQVTNNPSIETNNA